MTRAHAAPGSRRPLAAALLIAATMAVAACDGGGPARGPRVVRDGLGRSVPLPAAPRRVVSLAPSVTESLFALGGGDRVVGISDFCRLPDGASPVRRVGGMLNPSLETIRSLAPDLLIGTTSGNDPGLASQMEALGLPLYVLHTPDVEAVLASLEGLADALGDRAPGLRLVASLRARLEDVKRRVAGSRPPRVLFIVWGQPLVVPGRPAFLTDALDRAGGLSVTREASAAWPTFDLESAISRAPEVILTTPRNRPMLERLKRDAAWAAVPAVRDGRLYTVSETIEQPGPGVVEAIEEAAHLLHPDAFGAGGADEPAGKK